MIKIKIFCPFSSSKSCKDIYEKINYADEILFYGKDKKYIFTERDDYTHAIIINTIMPKLLIPKKNVIGLAFEPIYFLGLNNIFIEYAKKNIGKYFIGDKYDLPEPFIEHFGYMWYSIPPKEIQIKPKIMSIIVSEKLYAPGHKYRHEFVKNIIYNNLPIDIYGRGSNIYQIQNQNSKDNKNYKIMGCFNDNEPYENYMFSICIENYKCRHYFSEKIITPIMFNCMPIYYGCHNIDSYVENNLILTGNINEDLILIKNVLQNPSMYYKNTYTEKNIKAVNLIQNLPTLFT
jgi:uncharacterized CHY-type Zn-finger protein